MLAILITVHEFGHFIVARLCKIRVREFAIGMGPVIFKRDPKSVREQAPGEELATVPEAPPEGTRFTVRAVPFGGFCDMGEDEESNDPSHFRNKTLWQKILVLIAGSFMNFLIGVIIIAVMAFLSVGYSRGTSVITGLSDDFPYPEVQVGDRLVKVNGKAIYNNQDAVIYLPREGDKGPCTFVLERDGELIEVSGVERNYTNSDGDPVFGISFGDTEEMTVGKIPRFIYTTSVNYVRYIWTSLGDIIGGRAGLDDVGGPVMIGGVAHEILTTEVEGVTAMMRVLELLNLMAMIAINLAVVNMLPIPALDGGRILFLLISAFLMLVRKRPLSEKVEGYIHTVTYILLIGLMVVIFFNDILRFFR